MVQPAGWLSSSTAPVTLYSSDAWLLSVVAWSRILSVPMNSVAVALLAIAVIVLAIKEPRCDSDNNIPSTESTNQRLSSPNPSVTVRRRELRKFWVEQVRKSALSGFRLFLLNQRLELAPQNASLRPWRFLLSLFPLSRWKSGLRRLPSFVFAN